MSIQETSDIIKERAARLLRQRGKESALKYAITKQGQFTVKDAQHTYWEQIAKLIEAST